MTYIPIITNDGDTEDDVEEEDDVSDDELAVEEEGIATAAASVPDDGRGAHDDVIVITTRGRAIQMMKDKMGVVIDPEEEKMALQLFPRVSNSLIQPDEL